MGSAHHSLSLLGTTLVIFCSFAIASGQSEKLATFSTQYGPFIDTIYYRTIFQVISPATINNNALQVTPDTAGANDIFSMYNNSGRILLRRPFKLWDGDINSEKITTVASFNSSFLVNVFRPNNDIAGEGMAFVIAPNLDLPPKSFGQFLGLTNATTDGNSSNKIVAVELDTFKQSFDPDDNHLGLNVNSVRSIKTESLTPHGIEISPNGTKLYNVWVNYDGVKETIEVFMAEQETKDDPTPPMPNTPLLKSDLDLRKFVEQKSYFGFSASTGNTKELNCVLRWNLTVAYFPAAKDHWIPIVLGICVPMVVLILLGAVMMGYYLHKKRRDQRSISSNILGALRSLPGTPREFEFKDLKKATNNFDEKFKLGQGGYGVVYKCILPEEKSEMAVKMFNRGSLKGEDDFLAELTIINRLRHKNLVPLLGWCHKNGKLLLLYEYMPNGSLDMHLFAGPNKPPLSWALRYNIISGVASALHYLHNEYDVKVVHRDLKASNIMLDSKYNARLGDFGLARALDNEKTSYLEAGLGVLGTIGYIAPEIFHTARATQQSDVYAFGAVLIEVVCGQRPGTKIGSFQFLVDWVWSLYREGRILDAVDQRLGGDYATVEAERLLRLGLACSHPIACERPKTQTIVQIILGSVPLPHVPPFKPSFVWPAMVPLDEYISGTTTVETTTISTTTYTLGSGWSPQSLSRENYEGYTDHSVV